MSDDDYDDYGDTDPNNVPEGDNGDSHDTAAPTPAPGPTSAGDVAIGADQAPAADGDPRLMQVSDPVLDQEQNSWRWNDPEALAYDIDRKQRQLAEAKNLGTAAGVVNGARSSLAGVRASMGINVLGSLPAWAAAKGMDLYMNRVEAPRIESEVNALQTRLNQLQSGPKT